MKANKPTTARSPASVEPASRTESPARAYGAADSDTKRALSAPSGAENATPSQPNWTRYADSRLKQFYCR